MKKYLLFLFLFSIVVNMSGWDKPWKNGKLVVSNHRFLMFENGTPFFWQGETAWLMPERLNRDEAAYYLQTCGDADII